MSEAHAPHSPHASHAPADPVAAATHPDPYPHYARLRAGPPLAWHEGLGLWVASRPDVVRAVLAHPALAVRPPAEPVPRAIAGTPAGALFGQLARMNDGPAHAARRAPLAAALAGWDPDRARADAAWVAQRLSDRPWPQALTALPVRAVARALGFADAHLPAVADAVGDFVACLSPLSTPAQLAAASAAARRLAGRMAALIDAAGPGCGERPTLLRAVCAAGGDALPREALAANLCGLMSQACEATAGLLGNTLVALARDPAREAATATPEGRAALVAEVARQDPAVQNTRRFAHAALRLHGADLRAGDAVLVLLASASRADPQARFGFGAGSHACPGEAMAHALVEGALPAVLRRLRPAALAARGWRYRPSANARIPVFD